MTSTKVKVSRELRDRLKQRAEDRHSTIGAYLETLLEDDLRRQRFAELRRQIASRPPDQEYEDELRDW